MKNKYVTLLLIATISIGLLTLIDYLISDKELEISLIAEQKHSSKTLAYKGGINSYDWFIITSESQMKNLEEQGYKTTPIDFNQNFLIISRYKISKLYQKAVLNRCTGVPDGRAIFDFENSGKDYYYVYFMPNVMLSQGIG